jgi:hypothetical protein
LAGGCWHTGGGAWMAARGVCPSCRRCVVNALPNPATRPGTTRRHRAAGVSAGMSRRSQAAGAGIRGWASVLCRRHAAWAWAGVYVGRCAGRMGLRAGAWAWARVPVVPPSCCIHGRALCCPAWMPSHCVHMGRGGVQPGVVGERRRILRGGKLEALDARHGRAQRLRVVQYGGVQRGRGDYDREDARGGRWVSSGLLVVWLCQRGWKTARVGEGQRYEGRGCCG